MVWKWKTTLWWSFSSNFLLILIFISQSTSKSIQNPRCWLLTPQQRSHKSKTRMKDWERALLSSSGDKWSHQVEPTHQCPQKSCPSVTLQVFCHLLLLARAGDQGTQAFDIGGCLFHPEKAFFKIQNISRTDNFGLVFASSEQPLSTLLNLQVQSYLPLGKDGKTWAKLARMIKQMDGTTLFGLSGTIWGSEQQIQTSRDLERLNHSADTFVQKNYNNGLFYSHLSAFLLIFIFLKNMGCR